MTATVVQRAMLVGDATRGAWERRLDWAQAAVAAAIGLYVVASTVLMVVRCWTPLPFADQWDELVGGRTLSWRWMFSQHNEHRIFFPRLIFLLDYWLDSERSVVDLIANVVLMVGVGLGVLLVSQGTRLRGARGALWAAGMAGAFLFWSLQSENFVWGFQVQFFGVLLAALATFAVLAMGHPTTRNLALVFALEFVTVYTFSSGMIVPFLAVPLALWLRRPRRQVLVLAVAAVVLLASYLIGYHTPAHHSDPLQVGSHLSAVVAHAVAQLGAPFADAANWRFGVRKLPAALGFGMVGIVLFAALGWRMGWARPRPAEAVLLATSGFVLLMTIVIGSGRVRFGIEQAFALRYTTPILLFWLCLALLTAGMMHSRRGQAPVMAAALPSLAVIAATQAHYAEAARQWTDRWRLATPALLADVLDPVELVAIYPAPSHPLELRSKLAGANTSVFADRWSSWLGTRLSDHVTMAGPTACTGRVESVKPASSDARGAWRAIGRAWLPLRGAAADRILLVDAAGIVVGFGIGGLHADLISGADHGRGDAASWWLGDFAASDPAGVTAYALLDAGASACPIGVAKAVVAPAQLVLSQDRPADLRSGGFVDSIEITDAAAVMRGWGFLAGDGGYISVATNLPVSSKTLEWRVRPDVETALHDERLRDSGFLLRLELASETPRPAKLELCVWTDDPRYGMKLLQIPSRPDLCALQPLVKPGTTTSRH